MNKMIIGLAVIVIIAFAGFALTKGSMKSSSVNKDTSPTNTTSEMKQQNGVMVGGALMTPDKDIVDNAVNSSDHTTVVAAVKAAGLVETLKSAGPFTVFAPTNAAFEKLPAGTVETLLKPENKAKLTSVLTYHVVKGAYRMADLTDGQVLTTVNGQTLTVHKTDGKLMINNASVTIPDVISSNGVTFVVDTVLLPQ